MKWIYSDSTFGIGFLLCIAAGIAAIFGRLDIAIMLLAFGVCVMFFWLWAND